MDEQYSSNIVQSDGMPTRGVLFIECHNVNALPDFSCKPKNIASVEGMMATANLCDPFLAPSTPMQSLCDKAQSK